MKYIRPNSLTWWSSLVPLLAGLLLATEPLHGLSVWVDTINNLTGHLAPSVMINAGLIGIGMRAAIE